ncbi:ComEC family competence protein [Hyphomonadaceae bacterium ML37]|nr:ComEC family competence protein [Hyphomonadaceae bacterium ML37]
MDAVFDPSRRTPGFWERSAVAVLGGPAGFSAPDPSRLILWLPCALAAGAAAYFALPEEPPAWAARALMALAAVLLAGGVLARSRAVILYVLILAAMFVFGLGHAQLRTERTAPPPLEISGRAVAVEGWIEAVERGGTRPRLRIRVTAMDGAEEPPRRIRVRAGLADFAPGDGVRVRAVLSRPSGPAAPGGYDGGRAAWFSSVALTGYAIAALEPASIQGGGFNRWLAGLRWRLAQRVETVAGERTGAVAAALLTGERAGVSEDDAEALRLSGLGHILAISGLHMALFAGGVFFAVRFMLASIEPLARAHDPRKPAALIAILAATAYLILSGAAVSTQRAWIMACVVLIGVLIDRRAFSLRSLALAALAVLLIAPESVIHAGFQMSFAAVAALIAVYEAWMRVRPAPEGRPGLIGRAVGSFAGLTVTSLVAGAATGAFAAFHFQRMAAYGMVANLLAMPVFTFWVMPAGVMALAAAPFGLEGVFLFAMDYGLRVVLAIAHWTAGFEGAAVQVTAADGRVVALYAAGFSMLTLGLGLARLTGGAVTLLALALWTAQSPPSLMIADGGVVLARFEEGAGFQATNTRRARFASTVLLQRAGEGGARPERAGLACDTLGCAGRTVEGVLVAVTSHPEALVEDCERADLILFQGRASAWRKRRCAAILLDNPAREELGGAEVWIRDGRVIRLRTANDARRGRPWET